MNSPVGTNTLTYRPDIDGLRAIAVLSVVFCHAHVRLHGGYVGVDVFFVISGYLITGLILKDIENDTFSFQHFWTRRIRRIVPALLAVIIVALGAGWFLLLPDAYAALGKSVVGVALLISNIQFWQDSDYFSPEASTKPLLHTWSLAVEEQFYLLIPTCLYVLSRVRHPRLTFALVLMTTIASFVLSAYGVFGNADATFYLLPTRAWELLVGSIIAHSPNRRTNELTTWRQLTAAAGMFGIFVPCFVYDATTPFPGIAALPPVVGAALVIWSGSHVTEMPFANRLLACKPLVVIGLCSYSLYLWHWPLIAFSQYVSCSAFQFSRQSKLVLIATSVSLGLLSWRYIEQPFRERRLLSSRRDLLRCSTLGFVIVSIAGCLVSFDGLSFRLSSRGKLFLKTGVGNPYWKLDERNAEDIPNNLIRLGTSGSPKFLLWGDSHAMCYLRVLDSLCKEHNVAAVAATHTNRPPVVGFAYRGEADTAFNSAVCNFIVSQKIQHVVLAAAWNRYCKRPNFEGCLLETVKQLRAAGVEVYVVRDNPQFPYDVRRALVLRSLWGGDAGKSPIQMTLSDYQATSDFPIPLSELLSKADVCFLDTLHFFMARTESTAFVPYDEGGLFYSDSQHLSDYGASSIRSMFGILFHRLAE